MKFIHTAITGVVVIESSPFIDNRGIFVRLFCDRELSAIVGNRHIVQINLSRTRLKGAARGLHFQYPPNSEMKLVRCLKGKVWDVVVDIRQGSPSFLKWHGEELSPEKMNMVVIPEGCAHGFQALEAGSEVCYSVTAYYEPGSEGGLRFDDPSLGIDLPLPIEDLSHRDMTHPLITDNFHGIMI